MPQKMRSHNCLPSLTQKPNHRIHNTTQLEIIMILTKRQTSHPLLNNIVADSLNIIACWIL